MTVNNYTHLNKMLETVQSLRDSGLNVENRNGQYFVKIYDLSVPIYNYDDVFSVYARADELKKQQIRDDNNARYDKEIEAGKAKVKKYSTMFDNAMAGVKYFRHEYLSFLSNNHASTLSDLIGTDKYKEGLILYTSRSEAITAKNKALALLCSAANETVSACCHKIMYNA